MTQQISVLPPRNHQLIITNLIPLRFPQHIKHVSYYHYAFKTFSKIIITQQIQTYLVNKILLRFPSMILIENNMFMSIDQMTHQQFSIKTQFNNKPIQIIIIRKHRFDFKNSCISPQNRQNMKIIHKYFINLLKMLQYTVKNNRCYLPLQKNVQKSQQSLISIIRYDFKWFNNKLYLNIDTKLKEIQEKTLLDEIRAQQIILCYHKIEQKDMNRVINDKYKNKYVITTYGNNYIYKIIQIDFTINVQSNISNDEKHDKMNYKQYYKQKYNIKIDDQKQPLIKVGKHLYLVPELIKVISHKDMDINQHVSKNYKFFNMLSNRRTNSTFHALAKFDIQLSQKFQVIETRFLDYPLINVGNDKNIDNFNKNTFDFSDNTVYQSQNRMKIYLICPSSLYYLKIYQNTKILSKKMGIEIDLNVHNYTIKSDVFKTLKGIESQIYKQSQIQQDNRIFWIIIQDQMSIYYQNIKKMMMNNNLQQISQITLSSTLKSQNKYYDNIIMQMAAKLNITPWKISIDDQYKKDKKLLMIGIYTTQTIQNKILITYCCNINQSMTQYHTSSSLEIKLFFVLSTKVAQIVQKCIKEYKSVNNRCPDQIIIIRRQNDNRGNNKIQDGQIRCINNVISNIDNDIGVNYFAINKDKTLNTHRIKDLFKMKSCTNGTIIDKGIVNDNSFYILHETSIKDKISHIYYRSIYKQSSLGHSFVMNFIYNQSYNYYNFKGSVQVPAVFKYAQKLAKMIMSIKFNKNYQVQNMNNNLYFL